MEEIKLDIKNDNIKSKNKAIGFIVGGVLIIALIVCLAMIINSPATESAVSHITYENYMKIENDMSYGEVVAILGNNRGELSTSSSYGGYTLSYYSWTSNYPMRVITVGFQNGKVIAKSQIGLR